MLKQQDVNKYYVILGQCNIILPISNYFCCIYLSWMMFIVIESDWFDRILTILI